jgi:hypothetical protein
MLMSSFRVFATRCYSVGAFDIVYCFDFLSEICLLFILYFELGRSLSKIIIG